MASLQSYGDGASTTLGAGIDAVVTSLTLAGPLGAEWPASGQVDLNLTDTELVTGVISGTSVTGMTRGVKPYKGNTGGKVHASGDSVRLVLTSNALKSLVVAHPFRAAVINNANQGAVVTATFTKVSLQTESYDPNNNFDNVTNFRYTAPATGYYWVQGSVAWAFGAQQGRAVSTIYKNGAEVGQCRGAIVVSTNSMTVNVPTTAQILSLTAADYLELWAFQATGSNATISGTGNDVCSLSVLMIGQ